MPSTQNISDFRFFPVEILEIIFRIALARSSATASSVIRLNHGWRALLEPMMYQKIIFETETQLDLFMRRVSRKNKSRVNDLTIALNHIKWEPEYIDGLESLANLKALTLNQPSLFLKFVLKNPHPHRLHLDLRALSFFARFRSMPVDPYVTDLSVRIREWNPGCFNIFMSCFPNLHTFQFEIEARCLLGTIPNFESCLSPMIQNRVVTTILISSPGSATIIRL